MPDNDTNARLSAHETEIAVLKRDSSRHETDITKLWEKITTLEICTNSLPKIEKSVEKIATEMEGLKRELATSRACDQGQRIAYLTMREWLIVGGAILTLILEHFVIK